MPIDAIRRWLRFTEPEPQSADLTPLRALIDSLEHLEPGRARYLARFAYLLGRVAHADQHVSPEETRAMETLVVETGGLTAEQAAMVVGLAKSAHLMFGATADFEIAKEFADESSYDEKLALARCLFRVAATDASISVAEESEIHRIATHLKIDPQDVTALRVSHARFLPGLSTRRQSGGEP